MLPAPVLLRVARKRPAIFVAASNAPDRQKAVADFICDGVDDEAEIITAIGDSSGAVILSSGDFYLGGRIQLWDGSTPAVPQFLHLVGMGTGSPTDSSKGRIGTATLIHCPAFDGLAAIWFSGNGAKRVEGLTLIGPGQNGVAGVTSWAGYPGSGEATTVGLFMQYGRQEFINVEAYGFGKGFCSAQPQPLITSGVHAHDNRNAGFHIIDPFDSSAIGPGCVAQTSGANAAAGEVVANWAVTQQNGGTTLLGFHSVTFDETDLGGMAGGCCLYIDTAGVQVHGHVVSAPGTQQAAGGAFYGIHVGPNAVRATLRDLRVAPYPPGGASRVPNQTIYIEAGATDTYLNNIWTDPNGGGDILDNGTGTKQDWVNGV